MKLQLDDAARTAARTGRLVLLVGLAAWAGAGVAATAARQPGPRPPAGRLSFLRLTDGFWQLWVMAADGSGARALTRTPVDKVHVAWRPGRDELLYHTNRGDSFVLDLASGNERRVLAGLRVTDAAWSRDGARLAYALPPEDLVHGKTTLWTSDVDGHDRRRVAGGGPSDALAPAWLADGSILYRQCLMADNMEVLHDFWLAVPGDDSAGRLVRGDEERLKFDQTVSSRRVLAYSSPRSGSYEVWTLPLDGGPARQITRFGAYAGNPTWSPAGDALAFDSTRDGDVQVYRVGADGRGLVQLTRGAPARKPAWEPAGSPREAAAPAAPPAATARASTPEPVPTTPRAEPSDLAIRWVSTDKATFDPDAGEQVTLRFQVSRAAEVTVRFIDAGERAVRNIRLSARGADEKVVWDGRDDAGALVPADAYAYVVEAEAGAPASARGRPGVPRARVTYDLRGHTGGDVVWARDRRVDPASGTVVYSLAQASRVRVILSREDSTWPVRTLLDWAPRPAGLQREPWDGWDAGHVVKALGTPKLAPIVYAYSLPRNSVIVRRSAAAAGAAPGSYGRAPAPAPSTQGRTLHLHSHHPRERCFDPALTLSFPDAPVPAPGAALALTRPTTLRVGVAADQGPRHAPPIPRVSVFLFVDGEMRERYLVGYVPFQWRLDPVELGPGEHVVSALFSWRDDHFGIAHARVKVGEN